MTIEAITNYIQISDQLASSGQPEEHQFRYIAKSRYWLIINLAMPNSENAIPEEGYIVVALKMAYVHIPVPFEAPNVDHLRAFIRVMTAFSDQNEVWQRFTEFPSLRSLHFHGIGPYAARLGADGRWGSGARIRAF